MKHQITYLFLILGIIVYTAMLGSVAIGNILLALICICLLILLKQCQNRGSGLVENHREIIELINNIPMPAFLKDCQGNILVANKDFFEMLKISEDMNYSELTKFVYSNVNLGLVKAEEQQLNNKKTYIMSERLIKNDKEVKKYYSYKAGIYNRNNKLTNIAVFIKNIEFESDNCSNSDMIATITHDLKTPAVAQIRGIELLLNGYFGEINEKQRSFLIDILQSGNNMLAMLIDMLWLYKFDNKKITINISSFDINELVREVLKENKLLLNIKNSQFVQTNKTARVHILADKTHIKRIIHNILINAVTHSLDNSVIYINTSIQGKYFIFEVKNKGKNIDKNLLNCMNDRNKIFKQKCDGLSTGLGLYLSNVLLDVNGGLFICESTPDGLNTFGFKMKLSKETVKNNINSDIKPAI